MPISGGDTRSQGPGPDKRVGSDLVRGLRLAGTVIKWSVIGLVGLLALGTVIGIIVGELDDSESPSAVVPVETPTPEPIATATAVVPVETPTPEPIATATPEPLTYTFEGRGDRVLGPVDLNQGVLRLAATHEGSSNFIVQLVGEGRSETTSINHIGRYQGANAHAVMRDQLIGLEPGPHRLQVRADGPWTLRLAMELSSAGQPPPIKMSGSGDDVLTWVLLEDGQHVISATHSGMSNFIVQLLKVDGTYSGVVVNEIGNYDGENLVRVRSDGLGLDPSPGLYAVDIQADGQWTLLIE